MSHTNTNNRFIVTIVRLRSFKTVNRVPVGPDAIDRWRQDLLPPGILREVYIWLALANDGGILEGDLAASELWNAAKACLLISSRLARVLSSIAVDPSIERTLRSIAELQTLKFLSKDLLDLKCT